MKAPVWSPYRPCFSRCVLKATVPSVSVEEGRVVQDKRPRAALVVDRMWLSRRKNS
jgi:hypothetical protein